MKAITIWQPWAGFIAAKMKQYETRSWPTSHRGEIAIHSARIGDDEFAFDDAHQHQLHEKLIALPNAVLAARGAIIALATLEDCLRTEQIEPVLVAEERYAELHLGDFLRGRYAWKMGNVRVLDHPVPCRGKQGVWRVPPMIEKIVRDESYPF